MAAVTRSLTPLRNALASVFDDGALVDVDAVDVRGVVERELDAEDARAAADVEAAAAGADALVRTGAARP